MVSRSQASIIGVSAQLTENNLCIGFTFANFSLSAAFKKTYWNIYRSVEKENSPPDEENGWTGWGRMLHPATTTRIWPEFRLRNDHTKGTQCDMKSKPNLRSDVIWKLFAQEFCWIARDTFVRPKFLCIAAAVPLCPTSFVNDLVFCQLLWSRKENWLFSDYPSIPLAESKCWTPSRTFCPRISPKLPLLPHHQRRNRRRTGCSHLMGNSSFLFAFST